MYIRTIETVDGFLSLRVEWNRLLSRSRMPSPFLTHEWLHAWWSGYADGDDKLRILCCHDDETHNLIGVLPTYLHGGAGAVSARRLRFMGDALGATQVGCFADSAMETDVLASVIEWIASDSAGWDVLELRRMNETDPLISRLVEQSDEFGGRAAARPAMSCPIASLPGDWDLYLKSLSRRERGRVRRMRRDLEAVGVVSVERIRDPNEVPEALADAFGMFEQGMSRRHGRPYVVSDRYRRFMRSVTESFLSQDHLRLLFLTVDGTRTAFVWQVRYGDTMSAYQTAFDESWATHRVGTVLFGHAIQLAIEEGCTCYNFGVGVSDYKMRLATGVRDLHEVIIYRGSLRARAAAAGDAAGGWITASAKRVSPPAVLERLEREHSWAGLNRL